VSVESEPLFDAIMHWRVIDAVRGVTAEGHTRLADMSTCSRIRRDDTPMRWVGTTRRTLEYATAAVAQHRRANREKR